MKRLRALLRSTWWLFAIFLTATAVGTYFHKASLAMVPITLFLFFYFAFVRFDADGNRRDIEQ